jgi:hypothetical protein
MSKVGESESKQSLKILKTKLSTPQKQKEILELLENEHEMGDDEFEEDVSRLLDDNEFDELRQQWIDFWLDATLKARRQFLKQFVKQTRIKV